MRWKIALIAVITVGFLAAVLHGLDWSEAAHALGETSWPVALAGSLLYLVLHALRTVRLMLLVGGRSEDGRKLRFGRVFMITAIGFLAINVIPLRLGEAVRPWLLKEREGVAWGRSLAAVLIERLLDFASLLVMLLGVSFLVDLPAEGLVVKGVDVLQAAQRLAGTAVALGTVGGVVVVGVGEPLIRIVERLPLGGKLAGLSRRFREGLIALFREPLVGLASVGLTVAIWTVTITSVAIIMSAMPGIPVSLASAWTTWTVTLSGMVAVPTPGFFGAYELFCAAALWLFGVDSDLARTFALVLHLSQFGFIVLLGGAAMLIEGVRPGELVVEAPPPTAG